VGTIIRLKLFEPKDFSFTASFQQMTNLQQREIMMLRLSKAAHSPPEFGIKLTYPL